MKHSAEDDKKEIKDPNLFQDSGIPNMLQCLFWYEKQELGNLNNKDALKGTREYVLNTYYIGLNKHDFVSFL
jgi:hypothetical protein